jgi:hypothetical protein
VGGAPRTCGWRPVVEAQWKCACLWIIGLAGLRGTVPVEIVGACGLLAWQALGLWPGRDHACLWIAGLSGLRGVIWQRLCGSEGWEFRGDLAGLWSVALAGLRSMLEDRRSHGYGSGLGVPRGMFF